MAWMETDYSKHTYFRWKVKWRLEYLGALGTMGEMAPLIFNPISFLVTRSPWLRVPLPFALNHKQQWRTLLSAQRRRGRVGWSKPIRFHKRCGLWQEFSDSRSWAFYKNGALHQTVPSSEWTLHQSEPFIRVVPSSEWTFYQSDPSIRMNPSSEWTLHQSGPFIIMNFSSEWTLHQNEPLISVSHSSEWGASSAHGPLS